MLDLNGTGDSLANSPFTRQSLASPDGWGINTRDVDLRATQGARIDVTVRALGDAENLQGGTLLVTPLHG